MIAWVEDLTVCSGGDEPSAVSFGSLDTECVSGTVE